MPCAKNRRLCAQTHLCGFGSSTDRNLSSGPLDRHLQTSIGPRPQPQSVRATWARDQTVTPWPKWQGAAVLRYAPHGWMHQGDRAALMC